MWAINKNFFFTSTKKLICGQLFQFIYLFYSAMHLFSLIKQYQTLVMDRDSLTYFIFNSYFAFWFLFSMVLTSLA